MESVEEVRRKSKEKESLYGKRYGYEFRLRAVRLRLEEGVPVSLLSKELGVGKKSLCSWVKADRESGEADLRDKVIVPGNRQKLALPVRDKVVEIKRREPRFGVGSTSHAPTK